MAMNNRTMQNDKLITMRIPGELDERFTRIAKRYTCSRSMLIRMALTQFIDREEARVQAVDIQAKAENLNLELAKKIF